MTTGQPSPSIQSRGARRASSMVALLRSSCPRRSGGTIPGRAPERESPTSPRRRSRIVRLVRSREIDPERRREAIPVDWEGEYGAQLHNLGVGGIFFQISENLVRHAVGA